MPIPSAHDPCWQRLAAGGLARLKTDQLPLQLMAKRLERSSDSIQAKATEIYTFFAKFERILAAELQQLGGR